MKTKKLEELSDEELLKEAKKMKSSAMINSLFIGFLMGIVVYSIWKNTYGFLMIIPLFLVYKLVKKPKHDKKELEYLLMKRKLK
ncbi:FUSC family protein [Mangrovivirga cuniculi]|uniref:FUSC family protein n=1 Tax=Mangrovivirga cuniculi TaxID=2715131 RepID=A0A4D7JNB9_9BACT|nr:FUSC family protein [Mangrovivirga cuniculi]QCK16157.1 FUSC family protein [Mangrovivirga cuniculi]